ncbi:HAMP domain-containing protein [Geovibrio thiophilus]|uniref:histidine kinase n=1 Tax=Geovibrio thiophilus TaxID=139438 RepID=A0A3R5UVF7_9BACT|nr:ATP-binding protein [Geovibrio thiophilus]QAR33669.1 HAMP domain-containing protein [Geovibrio thiophilus]
MRLGKGGIFLKIFISFWISLIAFSILSIFLYVMSDKDFIRILSIKAQHSNEINLNILFVDRHLTMDTDSFIKYVRKVSAKSPNKTYIFDKNLEEITGQPFSEEAMETVTTLAKQKLRVVRQISDSQILNAFVLRDSAGNMPEKASYLLTVYNRPERRVIAMVWFKEYFQEIMLHIIIISLISFYLARHLTIPLKEINEASDRISQGSFDISLSEVAHRNDEFGELAHKFMLMAERLEENRQQQIRMFRDISHELRSPLTRMRLAIELALAKADQPTAKLLNRIETEWNRMGTMIADLKAVSDCTGKQIQFEHFDLCSLIENLMPDFHFEAEASGKKIIFNGCSCCKIHGNKRLLSSAIENIVRNSLRYAAGRIEIIVNTDDLFFTVEVLDDGHGVQEENLERIFVPFFRENSDRDRQTGGTGLGLAIAKRAADLHRGELYAANTDKGFCITMKLPV